MNNTIVLIGRLTHKPELKYTTNNKAILKSTIAIQRDYKNSSGEYETDFIDFQIWEKRAETMARYCKKGDLIGIKGSLRVENYQDKEGNNKKRSYVFVEKVSFLQTKPKKAEKTNSEITKDGINNNNLFAEFADEIEIEESDLPF
jgi:single-strand binding protein